MTRTLRILQLALFTLSLISAIGCQEPAERSRVDVSGERGTDGEHTAPWSDATLSAGIDFVHDAGIDGAFYYPEMTAPGAAMIDFDRDGDLDLFFVQSVDYEPQSDAGRPPSLDRTHRLYRNLTVETQSADGFSELRFEDHTAASGIVRSGYGQGVAVGDYDGDGWDDLYVTYFGPNVLWRNQGDGTFSAVPRAAGAEDDGWGQSAVFFDYDRDGWLDLYVTNYLRYSLGQVKECFSARGRRDYCGPMAYEGATDVLYRNLAGSRFEDVTHTAGVGVERSSSMGVVAVDFDGDGWRDLYVTNDQRPNNLWRNRGDGTFEDVAMLAGTALSGSGLAESSMGVDAADIDGDLDFDLVLTHLSGETNTLYRNDRSGWFTDRSQPSGVGVPSLPNTGFGVAFEDFDLDGWIDLAVINGAVRVDERLELAGDPWPYHQPDQLYRGGSGGVFEDVTGDAGPAWSPSQVGRGSAKGDLDNDGDADLVITNNDAAPRLLVNRRHAPNRDPASWIGVRALTRPAAGEAPWREAYGAVVQLVGLGAEQIARIGSDGGYLGANDARVRFALRDPAAEARGEASDAATLFVSWVSGRSERFGPFELRRYVEIREGEGVEVDAATTDGMP